MQPSSQTSGKARNAPTRSRGLTFPMAMIIVVSNLGAKAAKKLAAFELGKKVYIWNIFDTKDSRIKKYVFSTGARKGNEDLDCDIVELIG